MGALLSAIGGFLTRAAAKVAKKGASKAADAAKKGTNAARTAAKNKRLGKNTPKAQRTPKQMAARRKEAARIRAERAKARAKRQKSKAAATKGRLGKKIKRGMIAGGGAGALLGGGGDDNAGNPANPEIGNPKPQQSLGGALVDDPQIDMSWLPQAMAVSIPVIRDDEEERAYSLSNLIVTEDIEIAEEGGYQFIESGTMIPSRITEIGTLFRITDTLRDQINELNKRMVIANSNLSEIKKGIKTSIDENRATKRQNERRRDEADVEGGKGEKGIISDAVSGVALATKLSLLAYGMRALRAAALGGLALFANEAASWFDEEEGDFEPVYDDDEGEMIEDQMDSIDEMGDDLYDTDDEGDEGEGVDTPEEEIQAEEAADTSVLDDIVGVFDASEEGAAGIVNDASMGALLLGGTGAILGSGLIGGTAVGGAIAATATGAALIAAAPVLLAASGVAAATALTMGAVDYFEVDKKVADAYADWNEEELGEMASREEMNQKYGETQGTVGFFADLLGEGWLDTEEDPKEIYAAFRDMTWNEHQAISAQYQEEYGKSLAEATYNAVGEAGSEAINNLISENTMREAMEERSNEGDGVENNIENRNYATTLESAQEGQYLTPDQLRELGYEPNQETIDIYEEQTDNVSGTPSISALSDEEDEERFYTREAAELARDIRSGTVSAADAYRRQKQLPPILVDGKPSEFFVPGGVSISELEMPEVGNIIPINDMLNSVPEEIRDNVSEVVIDEVNELRKMAGLEVMNINSKVADVVDTTIDEKIQTAIMPIIRQEQKTRKNGLPAGTQGRSQSEEAGPVYLSRDPFIRHIERT